MFAVYEYRYPERFVAGTVGMPGQRTFYLQARDGTRITSVVLEKQQVAVLAERLDDLLDTIVRRSAGTAPIPAVAPTDAVDMEPLDVPVDEQFRVGTMGLGWDDDSQHVVIEAYAASEVDAEDIEIDATSDDDDDDGDETVDPVALLAEVVAELAEEDLAAAQLDDDIDIDVDESADVLRVLLSGAAARAFAQRAQSVVAAGRPACPFCTLPLDPEGHICPRQNGYRRRP
jgi:uncharacterized repeat protein (TIGR03847 family)